MDSLKHLTSPLENDDIKTRLTDRKNTAVFFVKKKERMECMEFVKMDITERLEDFEYLGSREWFEIKTLEDILREVMSVDNECNDQSIVLVEFHASQFFPSLFSHIRK